MTIPEEAAVMLDAFEMGCVQEAGVVRWADEMIIRSEPTPAWLIELSTMLPAHSTDLMTLLRKNAAYPPPLRRRIQVAIFSHRQSGLSLTDTVSKLFQIVIVERNESATSLADKPLVDTLVVWDCQETFPDIGAPLQKEFEALFQEYLADADEVAQVLIGRSHDRNKGTS